MTVMLDNRAGGERIARLESATMTTNTVSDVFTSNRPGATPGR